MFNSPAETKRAMIQTNHIEARLEHVLYTSALFTQKLRRQTLVAVHRWNKTNPKCFNLWERETEM